MTSKKISAKTYNIRFNKFANKTKKKNKVNHLLRGGTRL